MWLEKLKSLSDEGLKGPLKYLDLKFELHNAVYLIETLDPLFEFSIKDDTIVIKKDKKEITEEYFYFGGK